MTDRRRVAAARVMLRDQWERAPVSRECRRTPPPVTIDHTAERPVETADIIIPVERYALVYQVPVR